MFTNKRHYKAVLFDLDGVLIDSPAVHAWAWAEIFHPYGIEIPPSLVHKEEGRKSEEIARVIMMEYGLSIPNEVLSEMIAQKRAMFRSAFQPGLKSDAKLLIEHLHNLNLKTALVSGSARENVVYAIGDGDLELFNAVIVAEDCSAGKPAPEPYLTACNKLNISPNEGLAVENAPLGITSAKAAGLTVVALTSTMSMENLCEAHYIIESLSDVLRLII